MREREYWLDLNVRLCGQRMTTNYPRIGGVRNDTTELFDRDVLRVTELFEKRLWCRLTALRWKRNIRTMAGNWSFLPFVH